MRFSPRGASRDYSQVKPVLRTIRDAGFTDIGLLAGRADKSGDRKTPRR